MSTYLPPHPGLLPKWLLFISLVSVLNSLQTYTTLTGTRAVYSGTPNPVTPLSARTFGTWTLLSSLVRLYAAYHISNPQVYELCLWTYGIAWGHFMTEWWVFGTARWGKGLAGPVVVSTLTGVWMLVQWGGYVG